MGKTNRMKALKKALRHVLFGRDLPQQCSIPLYEPQQEIGVELRGLGPALDMTTSHVIASASPFTVALAFAPDQNRPSPNTPVSLEFRERLGGRRLGVLDMRRVPDCGLPSPRDFEVVCFRVHRARNLCAPAPRLWAHYLHWAYLRRRHPPDMGIGEVDARALPVYFICPRPVALVGVETNAGPNVFPMNLMGPLGQGYFGLALNSKRAASALVRRAGCIALATVPFEYAPAASSLGCNHLRDHISLDQLPFPTVLSPRLKLPIPAFALAVRELAVEGERDMGSHVLFLARILAHSELASGPQFHMVHGLYQAWRSKKGTAAPPTGPLFGRRHLS